MVTKKLTFYMGNPSRAVMIIIVNINYGKAPIGVNINQEMRMPPKSKLNFLGAHYSNEETYL